LKLLRFVTVSEPTNAVCDAMVLS